MAYLINDPIILRFSGLALLPKKRTLSRWLSRCSTAVRSALQAFNAEILAETPKPLKLARLTADVDGTVISTGLCAERAFRGFNPHHRKVPSYYPITAYLPQTNQFLRVQNRSGNVHDGKASLPFLRDLFKQLRHMAPKRKKTPNRTCLFILKNIVTLRYEMFARAGMLQFPGSLIFDGSRLALALDHHVIPVLAFGVEAQYDRITSQDDMVNTGHRSEAISTGSTIAVLANILVTPIPSGAGVYMGAGAGVAYARIKDTIREDGFLDEGVKASAWAPTVQAFLGFFIPIGTTSFMGAQWGYRFYQAPIKEVMATVDGRDFQSFDLADGEFDFDLSGPMVSFSLGHRF